MGPPRGAAFCCSVGCMLGATDLRLIDGAGEPQDCQALSVGVTVERDGFGGQVKGGAAYGFGGHVSSGAKLGT